MGAFAEHMEMVRDANAILYGLRVRGGRLLRNPNSRWVLDIKGGASTNIDNMKSFAYAGVDNTPGALTSTLREGWLQYGSDTPVYVPETIIPIIPETIGPTEEVMYIYLSLDLSNGAWSGYLGSSVDPQTYETDSLSIWTLQRYTISFMESNIPGEYIAYISTHFTRHDGDIFEERV